MMTGNGSERPRSRLVLRRPIKSAIFLNGPRETVKYLSDIFPKTAAIKT
jgi:hypothetical protein